MRQLRIVIIITLALAALPCPRPALAQSCTELDFTAAAGDFTITHGSYVAGQGYATTQAGTTEVLEIASTGTMSLTSLSLTWEIVTWGGGDNQTTDLAWIGTCPDCDQLIGQAPVESAGTYTLSWSGAATRTGALHLQLFASLYNSSDGLAYLRDMEVCGSSLPTFEISDPWPDVTPWARATPTPWSTPEATLAAFRIVEQDVANITDTAINMYHYANQQGIIDTLLFLLMTGLILGLIFRAIRKMKQEA